MDFQAIVDSFEAMTCVISVQRLEGGGYGEIRIVTGNKAYIDSIEHPMGGVQMDSTRFVPNSLYTNYLNRDLNFEDSSYRSAVLKKCLHSYAHPNRFDVWFNMTFLPLAAEDGDLCYCTYTMEINFEPSSQRMSNVSGEIASSVLESTITLRGATDLHAGIGAVLHEIRELCESKYCGVLLLDQEAQTCEMLGEDIEEGSDLQPMGNFMNDYFYDMVVSWEDTIAGSNCLIVKNPRDMEVVKERNYDWYVSLTAAKVESIALFPLKSHNKLLGYIWVVGFEENKASRIKEILELTTFILGSEIGSDMLTERLKVLSSRDMLTGVQNRNSMNNYVDELASGAKAPAAGEDAPGTSIGVVFADLNGLKTINDGEGHDAGDELLRNAAAALREVFDDETIFRAGGDEFIMILTGVTEEETERKKAQLRRAQEKYPKVSFAIGTCTEPDSALIHRALATADERMYADKREYYARRETMASRGSALV